MDRCPPEVLHCICALLSQKDLFSLRLCNSGLGAVGAYYLFKDGRIRFHCSPASFERVAAIANHPVFSQQIVKLHYESSWLRMIHSTEAYKYHCEHQPHHPRPSDPPPMRPLKGSSEREMRLYERNLQKWRNGDKPNLSKKQIARRYSEYLEMCSAQSALVDRKRDRQLLKDVIPKLPRLRELVLSNSARCPHAVSERFLERFPADFFPPLEHDTVHSAEQLRAILTPMCNAPGQLKALTTSAISPAVFSIPFFRHNLIRCFKSLKQLHLCMRLEDDDADQVHIANLKELYKSIKAGHLHEFLIQADELEDLRINFDDYHTYEGPCANLNRILGDHTWPHLRRLGLSHVDGKADEFLRAFKNQPLLESLSLGLVTLISGTWVDLLSKMRRQLSLKTTNFHDFVNSLEDGGEFLVMDHVDEELFYEEACYVTMAEEIDWFLTDPLEEDEDAECAEDGWSYPPNPAARHADFVCESELEDMDVFDEMDFDDSEMDFDDDMDLDDDDEDVSDFPDVL